MIEITGGGAFTRQNISDLNENFSSVAGVDVWVNPQSGNDAENGLSAGSPKASLAGMARLIEPGIVIGLRGVLTEEYAGPIVNDVTIRGMAGQPRQATTSGVANGGGATWLSPASGAATHLAIVKGQGWTFDNIYFNNSTAGKAAVQILISGGGDPPADPSAEHTVIKNCYFTGAKYGVLSTGGANFATLLNNTFIGFSDSGDAGIFSETGAGVHSCYGWQIKGNRFMKNYTHIDVATSGAEISGNRFTYIDNTITTTMQIDLTGGENNSVFGNFFDVPESTTGLAAMFVLGTNDRWYFNMLSTAQTTSIFVFGGPQTS